MNNNENKKSNEELADETLDKVVGGASLERITLDVLRTCSSCRGRSRQSAINENNGCCPLCGELWRELIW